MSKVVKKFAAVVNNTRTTGKILKNKPSILFQMFSADFSIDLAISGPFALMKGAKNLGKANKKFDESLKENNVNSDTIVNSNANLKRNEHSLNNKNGSVQAGREIGGLRNNDVTIPYIGKIKDVQLAKNINKTI